MDTRFDSGYWNVFLLLGKMIHTAFDMQGMHSKSMIHVTVAKHLLSLGNNTTDHLIHSVKAYETSISGKVLVWIHGKSYRKREQINSRKKAVINV